MKLSREIKAALIILLGIVVFIIGFSYLKGLSLLESTNTFYTEFDYNALTESSPVTIKGNQIGKVSNIKYDYESGKTRVAFTVEDQLKFSKNSKIRLYEMGLMGGNGIAIIPANDNEIAKNGDFIQSEVEEGLVKSLTSNFSGLSSGLDSTLKKADTLLTSLNIVLKDDSEKGLKHAVEELNVTLQSFQILSASANTLIAKNTDSIAVLISNFNKISKDLSLLADDLKDIQFSETIESLDTTLANLNSVLEDLNKGDGTLGKLLTDEKLYENLEGATSELESLLRDIKLHPNRYTRILSKREIPYEDTEN